MSRGPEPDEVFDERALQEVLIDEPDYEWLMIVRHCKVHPHAAGWCAGSNSSSGESPFLTRSVSHILDLAITWPKNSLEFVRAQLLLKRMCQLKIDSGTPLTQ
jgi:hypothetical protein